MTVSGRTFALCDENNDKYDLLVTVTKPRKTTQLRRAVTRDLVVIHTGTVAVDSWYRGLTSTDFCTSTYRYRLLVQGKISFLQRRFPAPAPLPFPHFQQRQLHANLAVYRFRCETMTSNTLRSQLLAAKSLCAVPNASHHESMTASLTVHSIILSFIPVRYKSRTSTVTVQILYRYVLCTNKVKPYQP